MGVVWFLFEKAETALNDEAKKQLSQWLRNLEVPASVAHWRTTFGSMFDRVFGKRHLSWRCFLRSSLASVVAIAIATLLWRATRPADFLAFVRGGNREYSTLAYPFWVFGIATIVNLLPDYAALLKTRYVIGRLSRPRTSAWRWLTIDLIANVGIWVIVTAAAMLVTFFVGEILQKRMNIQHPAVWMLMDWPEEFPSLIGVLDLSSSTKAMPPWGLFFYSTFFTSAWLWLYLIGAGTTRGLTAFGFRLSQLKALLDIDAKPLRSVGFVAMLFVTLVYATLPFVR